MEACMWKARLVSAIALATISSFSAFADTEFAQGQQNSPAASSQPVVSQAQISRLKSVLKLTGAQEQLWPAVESAFRDVFQQQLENGVAPNGLVQGISNKAAAIGLNALALRRLGAAAYPLIKTLSEEQKESAIAFARSMGLATIAAAF
jgi:hypothetical protein